MGTTSDNAAVDVEGKHLVVSHLEKVFYPESGFTKGEILQYYVQIAPVLLPHLRNRPVMMKRYPDGVEGVFFYQKNCPEPHPDWVHTVRVPKTGGFLEYCLIHDLPTLMWVVNLAGIELHTFLHRSPANAAPSMLVFDLDPGPPAEMKECCVVALQLRKRLEEQKLEALAKTSGSKGLQVYVPLNGRATYEKTKAFALAMATTLEKDLPDLVVSRMSKELRKGKVFVDWSQNDEHKTTVAVYSLRAKAAPTVSTPVSWREVTAASKGGKSLKLRFLTDETLARVKKQGDLFSPALKMKQSLPR